MSFGRRPSSYVNPTTGVVSAAPQGPQLLPIYSGFDAEPLLWFLAVVVFIGGVLWGGGWLVTKAVDHANYNTGCLNNTLCPAVQRARIAQETGAFIDSAGNITYAPRVATTHTPPAIIPAPVAAVPVPISVASAVPAQGPCKAGFHPITPPPGHKAWCAPD